MIKIQNTNNYTSTITCNGVQMKIEPKAVMEVNEVVLSNLPGGVVVYKETLTEIDPYTDKKIKENEIDTSQLLTEQV